MKADGDVNEESDMAVPEIAVDLSLGPRALLEFNICSKFGNWKFREGFRRSIPAAISVRKNVMIEHHPNSPARQPPRASVRNCRRSL